MQTVDETMSVSPKISRWHSHLLRYFEFIILLIIVLVWFNLQTWISPSTINLNLAFDPCFLWWPVLRLELQLFCDELCAVWSGDDEQLLPDENEDIDDRIELLSLRFKGDVSIRPSVAILNSFIVELALMFRKHRTVINLHEIYIHFAICSIKIFTHG